MCDPRVTLVFAGHLGFASDSTPHGYTTSLGGSAYACAWGVTAVDGLVNISIGLAAQIGDDFPLDSLRATDVSQAGLTVARGPSPRFEIFQYSERERRVLMRLGVAEHPDPLPALERYPSIRHLHLATMPPAHQWAWMRACRQRYPSATISVDMFESTVRSDTATSVQLCRAADMSFMNADEQSVLAAAGWKPIGPSIVKFGADGAEYRDAESVVRERAAPVEAVDTTGAGEILAAVYLAYRSAGRTIRDSLRRAVKAASESVERFGVEISPAPEPG